MNADPPVVQFAAFANGTESDKIVAMPTAIKIFADRIGRIEVSATMAVTAEAARLRAQGVQLVDFGAGEPHFATPRHIKDAAIAAIEANFTRYTVVAGIPELRKAIVQRHACDFGSDYTAEEAVFTTGGKLPHNRRRHRASDYTAHQGHHSEHAVKSRRLRRCARRPGTHRQAGP